MEIRDLSAVLGVPAYVAKRAAPVCGTTPQGAMALALERLLLAVQAREAHQPCYADPLVFWHDDEQGGDAECAVEVYGAALRAAGRGPTVLALDRDPAVVELVPHVVRVVCDG